jgi:hypothetical protein
VLHIDLLHSADADGWIEREPQSSGLMKTADAIVILGSRGP